MRGIQLFSGKFTYCADDNGDRIEAVKLLSTCTLPPVNGTLKTHKFNYDHIGEAFLTLFYVASFDGWVDQMINGVDAVNVGYNMQSNHSPVMALFYVVFLLVGAFSPPPRKWQN